VPIPYALTRSTYASGLKDSNYVVVDDRTISQLVAGQASGSGTVVAGVPSRSKHLGFFYDILFKYAGDTDPQPRAVEQFDLNKRL
jgi:hypothetical protein